MILARASILRTLAAFAVLMLLGAALPGTVEPDTASSLIGQLLVATPEMSDPRFSQAVILIVRHDKDGALGIIVNRPVEERSLASLLAAVGEQNSDAQGNVRIFAGGPVEVSVGFVIHSAEYHRPETLDVDGRVAVTASRGILHDMGHGAGPSKTLVAFGYAGWGPGQIESEIARKDWFTEPEETKLLFDLDRSIVWKEALSRRSREL